MSWRKLLCSSCNGALEIEICELHTEGFYLWCDVCQGGCDLETWIRWEMLA